MFRAIVAGIWILSVLHTTSTDELFEGDTCQLAGSGATGICKSLDMCPKAIEAFQRGEIPPHCGWNGGIEVICCPRPPTPPTKKTTPPPSSRISGRKCSEYDEAAYVISYVPSGTKLVQKKILRCHLSQVPFVVGGVVAIEKEFPHMALIGYRPESADLQFLCGGSLISDRFILTAAHCIKTKRLVGRPEVIRLGEYNQTSTSGRTAVVDIEVDEAIPHPNYKKTEKYDDIGLIRMKQPVQFSEFIRPACLSETSGRELREAIATGWGKTSYKSKGSDILMKVQLEMFSDSECRQQFIMESNTATFRNGINAQTQFCAGSRDKLKDVCQGDSGGPIQVIHPHATCIHSIVGVTSFGKQCSDGSRNGTSGVYTRINSYLDWIEPIVWPTTAPRSDISFDEN